MASKAIGHRVSTLQERWKKLTEMMANRKTRLEEAAQSQQVSAVMCVYVCVCGGACMWWVVYESGQEMFFFMFWYPLSVQM